MGYSFDSCIRYSEVDQNANLTWLKLLDYFQDCSVFHSESLDLGVSYLADNHAAWVINSWQICVKRMPKLYEDVTVWTWPYELKGFFGFRNFAMDTKDGERLAYANSVWTLIDTETNLPTKLKPEMARYDIDEPLEMEKCARKLKAPDYMEKRDAFCVTQHLLDTNGHVNNGRYVELAMGYLPEDFHIDEIRVEYKMQGRLGDVFVPMVGKDEEKTTIVIADESEKPYAIVQFLGQ